MSWKDEFRERMRQLYTHINGNGFRPYSISRRNAHFLTRLMNVRAEELDRALDLLWQDIELAESDELIKRPPQMAWCWWTEKAARLFSAPQIVRPPREQSGNDELLLSEELVTSALRALSRCVTREGRIRFAADFPLQNNALEMFLDDLEAAGIVRRVGTNPLGPHGFVWAVVPGQLERLAN